jgi:hypothetical protein
MGFLKLPNRFTACSNHMHMLCLWDLQRIGGVIVNSRNECLPAQRPESAF